MVSDSAEQARDAGRFSSATFMTALVSLVALLFSGVSLYQTVLKQANIRLYVPQSLSYTRDPNGSFEVLAVPVTMINSGARDGVVTSMQLKVRNQNTGEERVFSASYIAEAGYFSSKEDMRAGVSRPKRPFAPATVPGRSGHSVTILFYPAAYSDRRVIPGAGKFMFEISWRALAVDPIAFLENKAAVEPKPLKFQAELPRVTRYFAGAMMTGKTTRLFVKQVDQ